MAALIKKARLFIGNDSAPLHLAAEAGTRFVGIYGPSDPIRHRPFGPGEQVVAAIPASAYRNGFTSVDCISSVSVDDVAEAALRQWAEARRRQAV
jgi:ADP-heptose:LPS heptosyltransferase